VLMVAAMRGHIDLALYLLAHGANPNLDTAGYTVLHWASGIWESTMTFDYPETTNPDWRYLGGLHERKLEFIKALLAGGADVNARMTKPAPRYGIGLTFSALGGATPFFLAAQAADVTLMRLLVANGADPLLTPNDRTTALIAAAGF